MSKLDGPPDSAYSLFYNPRVNRFETEDGNIVHELQPWFSTWQLDKWKKTKDYGLLTDKSGTLWEVFYNNRYCNHSCLECSHRCEIYSFVKD